MSKPEIADTQPKEFQIEEGKRYAWCACGKSSNQPLCDGSHSSTDLRPTMFKAEKTEKVWLCMCKQTSNQPYCDGSHKNL